MTTPLQAIIAPYVGQDVTPTPFTPPGTVGTPPVHVTVGLKGGTKTFATSASSQQSYKLGTVLTESPPTNSVAVQNAMNTAAA